MKVKLLKKIRLEMYLVYTPSDNSYKVISPKGWHYDFFWRGHPPTSSPKPLTKSEIRKKEIDILRQNRLDYARANFSKYSKKVIIR